MKILLLTDSLSLPRTHKNGKVIWENTYVNLLRKKFPDIEFILVGLGGATITQLALSLNYYSVVQPDMVILHSGIVDCAPRALGQLELQLVIKLHLFRLVNPFTNLLRTFRKITYTKKKDFENMLLKIKNTFPDIPVITIGILPGCDEYEKKVPGISKNIDAYNEILERNSIFISNKDFPRDGILEDFHHLNQKGHNIIYGKLSSIIESEFKKSPSRV